jgi:hypothetical protein
MAVLGLGKDPDPAFENEGKDLRIRIKMFRIRKAAPPLVGRGSGIG